MDLSRLLARVAGAGATVLLAAGCAQSVRTTAAPLPTAAAAALQPFTPTATRPIPSPAPTLPSPTPRPTATPRPSATPTADPASATAVPTPTPDPARQINGLPFTGFAVFPDGAEAHVRDIFAAGRSLGRNANAFSKLGDSAVLTESNLTRFDNGPYTLGPYDFLARTIDYYAGSFARYGAGSRVALTTVGVFDPMWADPEWCAPGEHLLACEIRLHNPSVLLIRLGTNDGRAELYEKYTRQILDTCLENGVIPVLGTKADRYEGDDSINEVTRRLAAEYMIPLWDFDRLAETLPNHGLGDDGAHLSVYRRNDYIDPETFTRGYPMSDLAALVVLDAIRELTQP